MEIDFCHPCLKSVFASNTVSSDGYEIENLMSTDETVRAKGFLAERFISSPVIVTVTFPCPVNINYIAIWPQVGSQRSVGFELNTIKQDRNKPDVDLESRTDFSRLSVVSRLPSIKQGALFHRYGITNFTPEVNDFYRSTFFHSRNHENVLVLRIKIFKSLFVPAIKRIEVWGKIGPLCSTKITNELLTRWRTKDIRAVVPAAEPAETVVAATEVEVPDDFCDQITHAMMTLPIVLPSGKVIDQSTLERFEAEEARWGRTPSDPFTGVRFSASNKPVIATVLKSRIDAFCVRYADNENVKFVPRRLGSEDEFLSTTNSLKVSTLLDTKRKLDNVSETVTAKRTRNQIVELPSEKNGVNCSASDQIKSMLAKTLKGLKSYIDIAEPEKPKPSLCSKCSGKQVFYMPPCGHQLCRNCIFLITECTVCFVRISKANVVRLHQKAES